MVPKVIWSLPARADLHRIAAHIARDRPDHAKTYCFALIDKVEALVQFPFSGRHVLRQPSPHLHEFVLPPYRVIYEISPDSSTLEIVRVWDARRDGPTKQDLTG